MKNDNVEQLVDKGIAAAIQMARRSHADRLQQHRTLEAGRGRAYRTLRRAFVLSVAKLVAARRCIHRWERAIEQEASLYRSDQASKTSGTWPKPKRQS